MDIGNSELVTALRADGLRVLHTLRFPISPFFSLTCNFSLAVCGNSRNSVFPSPLEIFLTLSFSLALCCTSFAFVFVVANCALVRYRGCPYRRERASHSFEVIQFLLSLASLGNIFIHSGNDVNKPTDHLFFLDMALRAVGSEDRRLALAESNNGDEVKEDTIRKPMWACDDTRFTCAPICIQTEGKVTVEVEKSLCTEPVDPCLCNHVGYYVFSTSNFYSNFWLIFCRL